MTCKEKILSNDYFDLITDFIVPESDFRPGLEYCQTTLEQDLQISYINRRNMNDLSISVLRYNFIPKCYGIMDAGMILPMQREDFSSATSQIFNPDPLIDSGIIQTNNAPLNLTGRGVIIGFIDTGIRYEMDVFRRSDGSSRILAIWDQTIQTGTPPEGFEYGSEYTNDMINEALSSENPRDIVPSNDFIGHGTKMASVAAGSILGGGAIFRGAAPDAQIVMVKCKEAKAHLKEYYKIPEEAVCFQESDILCGLKYLDNFAKIFNRPVIICIGMGTNSGDHMGNSILSTYLDRLANRRSRGVVVCGGNEGNAASHYEGYVSVTNGRDWQDVEIRVGENEEGFLLELWGDIPNLFTVSIRSPSGEETREAVYTANQPLLFTFIYSESRVQVEYALVEQSSGEELVSMRFTRPISGIWTIRVYARGENGNSQFNAWLPICQFLRSDTYFLQSNPNATITAPAYAQNTITVTNYNSINNSFYYKSGRGFGRRGSLKPDLAAPGVNVSTALGPDTGSSLSAAITAGAMADFYQWAVVEGHDTIVNTPTARNYFIRGATRENGMEYPNTEWGFGRLSLSGVFEALARS
ncbi:MAG: S8 family peptidase [Lachnospiraceae bacterium]|nr:S8 family peptidase [Lachnospiraceae bacterium]